MYVPFSKIPDDSRIWIYQSEAELTVEQQTDLEKIVKDFLAQWKAHQQPLLSSFDFLYNHFLIIAVDEGFNQASGCSIDASMQLIRGLEQRFRLSFTNRNLIALWIDKKIELVKLNNIPELVQKGELIPETIYFNNLASTKNELETNWKVPAGETWLKKYFKVLH
jgi:hypothetical protein